jgi:uroporphyrinogen decarboxylase
MTSRERLIAYAHGQPVDRVPFVTIWGPWEETRRIWKTQGMKNDNDWFDLFGFDTYSDYAGVNFTLCPAFQRELVADEGRLIVFRDEQGVLQRGPKDGTSMSEWLEYPVKDRATWDKHKWRFNPDSPERFPADWENRKKELKSADGLVSVGFYPYGFLGGPRTMMGAEECLEAMIEDPVLIADINETLCDCWCRLLDRVCQEIRVDHVCCWEDMAGKNGSLISPVHFRKYMTPHYQRIARLARKHGVKIISVDSDGYMHGLTPLFIEAGMNHIFPYEVQAGNDLALMMRQYPDLMVGGHIDKRAMIRGGKDTDAEIARIRGLLKLGRFLPYLDHLSPPDVSWANYQDLVWKWKELTGKKD